MKQAVALAQSVRKLGLLARAQGRPAFEALAMVIEGALVLTIGGTPVRATPGTIVRMPANSPHAVDAPESATMLLTMLRHAKEER